MEKGTNIQIKMDGIVPCDLKGKIGIVSDVVNEYVVYVNINGTIYKLYTCDMIEVKPNMYNQVEVKSFDNQKDGVKRRLIELTFNTKMFMSTKDLRNIIKTVMNVRNIELNDINIKYYKDMNLI